MSSIRQPGEFVLQVVVWLLPQAVLTDEGKLRETLQHTQQISFLSFVQTATYYRLNE